MGLARFTSGTNEATGPFPPRRSGSRSANQGFSLTDLLVVIAITAVLIAVFVARAGAKDPFGGSRCMWNQRQLMLAFHMYADDNRGIMVHPTGASGGGGFWPGPQPSEFTIGMSVEEAISRVKAGLEMGALWTYLPQLDAYHCPDDLRSKLNEVGRGWAYDSYAKADGMNGGGFHGQVPIQRMESVPEPAFSMVFVEETDPRGRNLGTWVIDISPPGWADPLAVNHNKGGTFSFLDGHVELRLWRDPITIEATSLSSQGIQAFYWPGGTLDNPDFRWVFRRYKHQGWTPF